MANSIIPVDIVQSNTKHVYIKLPFMEIPVKMNHEYFHSRVDTGYFKIKKRSLKKLGQLVQSKAV